MPEFTVASLTESLRDVNFPIRQKELLFRYGEVPVQLAGGEMITLESALSRIDQAEFKSFSDLSLAIGEITRRNQQSHL